MQAAVQTDRHANGLMLCRFAAAQTEMRRLFRHAARNRARIHRHTICIVQPELLG